MPAGGFLRAALTVAGIGLALSSASCGRLRGARPDAGGDDDDTRAPTATGAGGDGVDALPIQVDTGGVAGDAGVDRQPPEEIVGPICSSDHWCWENPLPQGNTLNAVFTFADDNVWAVGTQGTVLHWNGKGWTNQYSVDSSITMTGLWGSAPNDLWMVGVKVGNLAVEPATSVIRHWDGFGWTDVSHPPSMSFADVTGSAPDNVWAVGASAPLRWDGTSWKQQPCPFCCTNCTTLGVWTDDPGDVWVVGPRNLVARWEGSTWTPPAGVFDAAWSATWGSGPNDVWVVGQGGALAHWNGSQLTVLSLSGDDLLSIWGSSATDVWAVGLNGTAIHYDGFGWRPSAATDGPDLYYVRGRDSSLMWTVGRAGRMLSWDGSRWTPKSSGPTGLIGSMAGSGPDDIWFGGNGDVGLQHWGDQQKLTAYVGGPVDIVGLFSLGPDEVFAVGASAATWDGVIWNDMPGAGRLYSVWGSSAADVWAGGANELGEPQLKHWDGQAWTASTQIRPTGSITHLAGNGPSDVWAVSTVGEIFHYDGIGWTSIPTGTFSALWGATTSGINEAWAVGEGGAVYKVANGAAVQQPAPFSNRLEGIFQAGPNEFWVAGFGGTIGHFDGNSWSKSQSGTDAWLFDIWASGPNDFWAVGFDGAVLHKRR